MRLIDADALLRNTVYNTLSAPYITKRDVEEAPTVDAAPVRHGRWIKETDRENHWNCSECGVVVGIVAEYSPYCYKCGAKMDGGEE